jgi:uncharacterized protein YsxB (DUF464 family)
MVSAVFSASGGDYFRVRVSGHALPRGKKRGGEYDLLCAAVSSAVMLAANTLTEYCGGCEVGQGENEIDIAVKKQSKAANAVLAGLELHLRQISKQSPEYVRLSYEEI